VAKAKSKSSTGDEIWFNDAVQLLADRCGSADDAQKRLVAGLKTDMPYSHLLSDGIRVKGDAAFWKFSAPLDIHRTENRASHLMLVAAADPDWPAPIAGIKVSRAAALALVPADDIETPSPVNDSAAWIKAEIKTLLKAGKVPADIGITDLARKLEKRVPAAVKAGKLKRPIGQGHIKNSLLGWGLWPLSNIK
jgi:hypothetical protein